MWGFTLGAVFPSGDAVDGLAMSSAAKPEVSDSEFSNNPLQVTLGGWEYLRLSAGADFRGDGAVGWSAFGLVGFGRYDTVKDASGTHHPSAPPTHAWIQLGVKVLLGP